MMKRVLFIAAISAVVTIVLLKVRSYIGIA
jgi:hypothetical protein